MMRAPNGYQCAMRALVAVTLAVFAAVLSACGAEDISPEAIADAAKATAATGGSSIAIDGRFEGPEGEFTMTGEGVMDAGGRRARVDYSFDGVPGLGEMKQVMDGYVMYMRMPALESELPDGRSWIRMDLREATKELGLDIAQFGGAGGSDATRTLDYLRATGDVEKDGEEEVRGVETTHYRAVVDLRKYPQLVPESERAEAERGIDALVEMTGEEKIPTDVWIDDDNLVRRMRQQMDMRMPGAGTVEMDMSFELFDFGRRVNVEPPPADQVKDVTDLVRRQSGRQSASP